MRDLIHPNAKIARDVTIAPNVTIEEDVVIEEGCTIGPNAVIMNGTRMGTHCKIHAGAVIGNYPQDLKFAGEYTLCVLEDHVSVREYATVNRGTAASGLTRIASHALIMAYAHIAHDCIIGSHAIISNVSQLAGHVTVGDYAIVGGMTAVHQFVTIGRHAFVGGGTLVRKDVPPYVKAAREPLAYEGVNVIGLTRRGFSQETIKQIQDVYRVLFVRHSNISQSLNKLDHSLPDSEIKQEIIRFISSSERGVIRGYKNTTGSED